MKGEVVDDRILSPGDVQRMMVDMSPKDRAEAFKDLVKSHEMLRARMLEAEVEARGCQSDVRQLAELREILTKPIGKVTLGGESGVVYEASLVKKATKTRSVKGRSLS